MDPNEFEQYYENKKKQIISKKEILTKECFDRIYKLNIDMEDELKYLKINKEKEIQWN